MKFKNAYILVIISFFLSCNLPEIVSNKDDKSLSFSELSNQFKSPSKEYYPETWFHLNGNNISKEGLKLDLQAIKDAGFQM